LLSSSISGDRPTKDQVVARTLASVNEKNRRLDEIHEHPLGFGFLNDNAHKDLFKQIADSTELPKDVTEGEAKPVDPMATAAMGLG
jgi:hypothetical protein